jgi:dTDP-4-amino-4,6-dideoxygalactose transaminase
MREESYTLVPFINLKAQYHSIRPEIDGAIARILESSQFVLGEAVASFEKEFAGYCNTEHAIAVNSGTSALHLSLLAAGIGRGDEVITTPFTFVATVATILYTGARPILVDINPKNFNIEPTKIEQAITARTKAIIPVHLYGQPAEMDPIMEIAQRHRLIVIEDACQAHGAEYKNERVGSIGAIGCFSFYPGKNLGASGEGGAVTTSNSEYARSIRMLRDWGAEKKYEHLLKGYNYRMEGFQGAILGVKLRHLEAWTETRRAHARRYNQLLAASGVYTPVEMRDVRHVYHVYAIRTAERDYLHKVLGAAGVQTGIHYPVPVHLQPAYADLGYRIGDFPHAEAAAREVLSLPIFPEITEAQIQEVVAAVNSWRLVNAQC